MQTCKYMPFTTLAPVFLYVFLGGGGGGERGIKQSEVLAICILVLRSTISYYKLKYILFKENDNKNNWDICLYIYNVFLFC